MTTFSLLLFLIFQGIKAELSPVEAILDSVTTEFRDYDTQHLLYEENPQLENWCKIWDTKFINDYKDRAGTMFKGMAFDAAIAVGNALANEPIPACVLLDEGNKDEAFKMMKEVNKYASEAEKYRFALMAYMQGALESDSKATLPQFLCMVKQFYDKVLAIYPDKNESKQYIKTRLNTFIKPQIEALKDKHKIKASESCQLEQATSSRSENKSYLVLMGKTIDALDNRK